MTAIARPRRHLPPFDRQSALAKVQASEDAWNTRDPWMISLGYSTDSVWRHRDTFITGRDEIVEFLIAKFRREHYYALRMELWAHEDNRLAVRYQYEWHDESGQWWRSYGNELWEFDQQHLNRRREGSVNDVRITEAQRRILGPRSPQERGVAFPLR
jgi:uncharacterized protein